MRSILRASFLLLMCCSFTGCHTLKTGDSSSWNPFSSVTADSDSKTDDEFGEPVRMAVIWKDATYSKPGSQKTRGFGGRIFLYDAKNQPVKADGELVVYGFDDSENKSTPNADRKYVFRQSEFQNHYSDSGLGPSYSVWVPWGQAEGFQKTIAMIPVFKTESGRVLQGGHSISLLPGKVNPELESLEAAKKPYKVLGHSPAVSDASRADPNSKVVYSSDPVGHSRISQASFESYPDANQTKVKTTTISVPESLADRLNSAPQQDLSKVVEKYRRRPVTQSASPKGLPSVSPIGEQKPASDVGRGKAWWNNPFSDEQSKAGVDRKPAFGKPAPFK